ncbi:hypothetical protein PMZ80_007007 [Knufia obscura]|uniref:Uncharacterized protein n=1 Tax=Knufia obscura TaxID=1635080 RepID=A0ABR0RJ26_9EURO|nr:hypothetical protein PMZ80_007007 [Knufia obscura]
MPIQLDNEPSNTKHIADWLAGVAREERPPDLPLHYTGGRSHNVHRRSRPSVPDGEAIGSDPDLDTVDPTEKYAKRRRHKTKADKYEYKGDVGVKRSAKGSRGSKRKRLRGSNTLNEDFQATNVDVARVSLKPENNLGIFSRSKKSVPLPGRDLPDLTFTKMDFLSKPAEAAKRDLAKIRMQQSDKKHKRDMTDEHFRAQSGLENSTASMMDEFLTTPYVSRMYQDEIRLSKVFSSRETPLTQGLRSLRPGAAPKN